MDIPMPPQLMARLGATVTEWVHVSVGALDMAVVGAGASVQVSDVAGAADRISGGNDLSRIKINKFIIFKEQMMTLMNTLMSWKLKEKSNCTT